MLRNREAGVFTGRIACGSAVIADVTGGGHFPYAINSSDRFVILASCQKSTD